MANHPSAVKRHRQSLKRRMTNQMNRHKLKTQLKKMRAAIATGKQADAKTALPATFGPIDRAERCRQGGFGVCLFAGGNRSPHFLQLSLELMTVHLVCHAPLQTLPMSLNCGWMVGHLVSLENPNHII